MGTNDWLSPLLRLSRFSIFQCLQILFQIFCIVVQFQTTCVHPGDKVPLADSRDFSGSGQGHFLGTILLDCQLKSPVLNTFSKDGLQYCGPIKTRKQGVLTQPFVVNYANLVSVPFTSSCNANP